MSSPAQQIAEHYHLQLDVEWHQWFNIDSRQLEFAGDFIAPVSVEALLEATPQAIWPGLMCPDWLPIIGNNSGDWLCGRVDHLGKIVELLHWYHGGGDWIPIGHSIAAAILHDTIDQARPRSQQVLRGAIEFARTAEPFSLQKNESLIKWFQRSLPSSATVLHQLFGCLQNQNYLDALRILTESGLCAEAAACDMIECTLQQPVAVLARTEIPQRLGINWEPHYVRWLFDVDLIPRDIAGQVYDIAKQLSLRAVTIVEQDWRSAEECARRVLQQRSDLGWPVDIAGWAAQRRGDLRSACDVYFEGRFTSAFSNQSVRMRTHWFEPRFGKFSLAQLWEIRDSLTTDKRDDPYLQLVWHTPTRLLQRVIQEFWMKQGRQAMERKAFAEAYEFFYKAGWDIGAQRMTDYFDVLSALRDAAQAAGWKARAAVASTHLTCLSKFGSPKA